MKPEERAAAIVSKFSKNLNFKLYFKALKGGFCVNNYFKPQGDSSSIFNASVVTIILVDYSFEFN